MLFNSILAISSADPLDLAPLIYGFVVTVAVVSAFIGFWRGFMRQTVRTITVIISAISPTQVFIPVFTATAVALPDMTGAEVNTEL